MGKKAPSLAQSAPLKSQYGTEANTRSLANSLGRNVQRPYHHIVDIEGIQLGRREVVIVVRFRARHLHKCTINGILNRGILILEVGDYNLWGGVGLRFRLVGCNRLIFFRAKFIVSGVINGE